MKAWNLALVVWLATSNAAAAEPVTSQEWADIYARVAVLEAAFNDCTANSGWVGPPGVIAPACRTVADMKAAGFLRADYVVPTVCNVPPSGHTAWMFVQLQQCDRRTLCPVLISRFRGEGPQLGLATAVERVRQALALNGLLLPDDETVFARALAGEGVGVNVAEWVCSLPRKGYPDAAVTH